MTVREGGTEFVAPLRLSMSEAARGPAKRAPVFYNPAMAISRDLHVSFVRALAQLEGRPLRVWDALAASGIRGARSVAETDGAIEHLLATDLQPDAVKVLTDNLRRTAPGRADARAADAHEVPPEAPFDLVDLDPYGSPMPFLETALTSLRPGGVLGLTATDMAVLAGPERGACERRYGGRPLRNYLCREAGLRILIAAVSTAAARGGRRVHPLLSYARDHHVRAYLRLDPMRGDEPGLVSAVPFEGYEGPPLLHGVKGGPLWTGPLHDPRIIGALAPPKEPARPHEIRDWIELLRGEAAVDVLFYYESGEVGKLLRLPSQPPLPKVLESLKAHGWRAARTPMEPSGWRTDAPWEEVARVVAALGESPRA